MIKMICDCCGKEFLCEYYEGGYIDHVTNFSSQFDWYANCSDPVGRLSHDIIFGGQGLRSIYHMSEMLYCAKVSKHIPDDVKQKVEAVVSKIMDELTKAHNEVRDIEKTASPLAIDILHRDSNGNSDYALYRSLLTDLEVK